MLFPLQAIGSVVPKLIDDLPLPPLLRWAAYKALNRFLSGHEQHLFMNTSVRDLIYGYRLDMLDTIDNFSKSLERIGVSNLVPTETFPNNSFGVLHGRNGTLDGPADAYTGLGGTADKFSYYVNYKNQT